MINGEKKVFDVNSSARCYNISVNIAYLPSFACYVVEIVQENTHGWWSGAAFSHYSLAAGLIMSDHGWERRPLNDNRSFFSYLEYKLMLRN